MGDWGFSSPVLRDGGLELAPWRTERETGRESRLKRDAEVKKGPPRKVEDPRCCRAGARVAGNFDGERSKDIELNRVNE